MDKDVRAQLRAMWRRCEREAVFELARWALVLRRES